MKKVNIQNDIDSREAIANAISIASIETTEIYRHAQSKESEECKDNETEQQNHTGVQKRKTKRNV